MRVARSVLLLVLAFSALLAIPVGSASARDPASATTGERPPARCCAGMASDATRRQVVMFGGRRDINDPRLDDTWIWDGSSWARRDPATSPSARSSPAMAYDPARDQVVLFGGYDGQDYFNDTWIWDGATWTEESPDPSPPPGIGALAFDAATQLLLLFTGTETWTWDGATWTKQHPLSSPPYREFPGMAPDGTHVVLFGGEYDCFEWTCYRGDTWTWDGTTWLKEHAAHAPSSRSGVGMAFDFARHQVVLFGGVGNGYLDQTWTWDGTIWTRLVPANSPRKRWTSVTNMAYDQAGEQLVLFGGEVYALGDYRRFRDTWTWGGTTWERRL